MNKIKHRAYPVKEWGGFVWAWLGDKDAMPDFDPPAFAPTEYTPVAILKMRIPCNWAQIHEGQIDSAHSSSLHSSGMKPARVEGAAADDQAWYRPSTDKSPRMQTQTTSYGFHYAAIRPPIKNAATHDYLRITEFIAPYYSLIPPNSSYNVASVIVSVDDETTHFHFIAWGGEKCPSTEEWRRFNHTVKGVDVDERWVSRRTLDNNFLQDREAMKNGSFTGVKGIPNQDVVMWVSMGKIVDRTNDVLGASDLAIVEFRRLMVMRRVRWPAVARRSAPRNRASRMRGSHRARASWPTYRVYPTAAEALARFRFLPPQPSHNDFVTDYIARSNLKHVEGGWTWIADPKLRYLGQESDFFVRRLPLVRCPFAIARGGRSGLISADKITHILALAPPGTVSFEIPEADHHVMVDQPLAVTAALEGFLSVWPEFSPSTSCEMEKPTGS